MNHVHGVSEAVECDIKVIKQKIGRREREHFRLKLRVPVPNLKPPRKYKKGEREGQYSVNKRNDAIQKLAVPIV